MTHPQTLRSMINAAIHNAYDMAQSTYRVKPDNGENYTALMDATDAMSYLGQFTDDDINVLGDTPAKELIVEAAEMARARRPVAAAPKTRADLINDLSKES